MKTFKRTVTITVKAKWTLLHEIHTLRQNLRRWGGCEPRIKALNLVLRELGQNPREGMWRLPKRGGGK